MVEIRLPQFGMGMTDGTILAWHKQPGERVEKGEPLCDIEAAKTTVEFESPESGTLARIVVQTNENVPVNTLICEIETGASADGGGGAAAPPGNAAAMAEEADVPAEVAAQLEPGGSPPKASPLARREAEQSGIDLAELKGSGARGKIVRNDVAQATQAGPAVMVQVEPRARKAAKDRNVDLATVAGSGPDGRIVAEDVVAAADAAARPAAAPPAQAPAAAAAIAGEAASEVPHSMMRRTIARRLTESKQQVPHFYVKASCRIDALLAMRRELNDGSDTKISVNDLIVRAVALALRQVPDANVSWGEKAMLRHAQVDVAVAVASPRGLVTPIVRAVETKPIRQVAAEVKELAERGKAGKLKPEEYQGGTTSVSNLGMFGTEEFTAILNPPQATIFAVGAGEPRVIVADGAPTVATMMTVTISVDHRAVDGAVAAELLAAFKRLIETPARILA